MPPLKKSVWVSYLNYIAAPYDAPLALFASAENRAAAFGDPSLRWSRYLRGGFEVTPIEGQHLELFSPANVGSVGGALRASLERADGTAPARIGA
jgi:thioesterase domain-containing protein